MKTKIFTESGKNIGLGHLSRCVSLYEEIESRGIEVEFYIFGLNKDIAFLKNKNVVSRDWLDTEYLDTIILSSDYVIIDSYLSSLKIYDKIFSLSKNILIIDDYERLDYPNVLIVNPSINSNYSDDFLKKHFVLSGSKYVIIRSDFLGFKKSNVSQNVKNVLVTVGGMDTLNITPIIIEEICKYNGDINFDIIVNQEQYEKLKLCKYNNVNYHTNFSSEKMSFYLNKADMAITSAGQTIYELIYSHTPFIAIQVAENQSNNVKFLENFISQSVVLKFNQHDFNKNLQLIFNNMRDFDFRKKLLIKVENYIDGLGSKRIIDEFIAINYKFNEIFIRKATSNDMYNVFELSNKEYVRKHSITENKIIWDEHLKWFNDALENRNIVFYIVTNKDSMFLGQVRFSITNNDAIISISLTNMLIGKGLSKSILDNAINTLFQERTEVKSITALVSESNLPSLNLFKKLNFSFETSKSSIKKFKLRRTEYYENSKF